MVKLVLLIHLNAVLFGVGYAVFIDGCPAYGCRPSGSFSFYMKVSKSNVSVSWGTTFELDAVPSALGCASDSVSIICQSNGVFSNNRGYISLYRQNGTKRWRDELLVYPSLPLLDNYGDVTGSDGEILVHFDADGSKYPVINSPGLAPIYSIELIGTNNLLIASAKGDIVVRLTNGIPVGYIRLNDVINNITGTFVPISQPVVNGMRFYVLTEFVPEESKSLSAYNPVQRLYAIDVHNALSERIKIAWFYTFNEEKGTKDKTSKSPMVTSRKAHVDFIHTKATNGTQGLLWKETSKTIFVSLPPVFNATKSSGALFGVRDNGSNPILNFRSEIQLLHMASFEEDHSGDSECANEAPVWVGDNKRICSIDFTGLIGNCFNISDITSSTAILSTKISVVRNDNSGPDTLIFGMTSSVSGKLAIQSNNVNFSFGAKAVSSFITAVEVVANRPTLLWSVPMPEGYTAKGQLTGSSGADTRTKDKLIVYAENGNGIAKIFSVE